MRLEITRKSDLALKAMLVLGRLDRLHKGSALAELIDTTPPFIGQVMAPLVRVGWVVSVPGRNGGYRLNVALENVTLLELIEIIEGPSDNDRCVLRGTPCPPVTPCALHHPWTRARTALLRELALTSLSDLQNTEGAEA